MFGLVLGLGLGLGFGLVLGLGLGIWLGLTVTLVGWVRFPRVRVRVKELGDWVQHGRGFAGLRVPWF